jgi:hypothetical protein
LVGQTGAGGSVDSNNSIHPRRPRVIGYGWVKSRPWSHQLCPVTQWEQCGYWKTTPDSCGSFSSGNWAALTGWLKAKLPPAYWEGGTNGKRKALPAPGWKICFIRLHPHTLQISGRSFRGVQGWWVEAFCCNCLFGF